MHNDEQGFYLIIREKNGTDERIFRNVSDKCTCIDAISNMKLFVHKLVLMDNVFDVELYDLYHHLREKVGRSYDTDGYRSNHYFDSLISKDLLTTDYNNNLTHEENLLSITDGIVEETHGNISCEQNEDSSLNHNVYFSPYSQKLSSPNNRYSMIDFDTELHKVDDSGFTSITDKLHEAMLRNQKYGIYVAPLLLKMTDYLDGTGSFQDLPNNIN